MTAIIPETYRPHALKQRDAQRAAKLLKAGLRMADGLPTCVRCDAVVGSITDKHWAWHSEQDMRLEALEKAQRLANATYGPARY